ncbi:MAG: bifunctional metallophosphatase/5'-nucleotidase [Bdellovibrionota bacterium]
MRSIYLVPVLVLLAIPRTASARLLQIIHTNDLHSHLEHAQDPDHGSYAALKFQIERLKTQAKNQGIDTLVLDAGDFSEGTHFFLADKGEASWRMVNEMGYDAVAVGNHEYLMGQDDLDRIVGNVKPNFHLLCANFEIWDDLKNLPKYLHPYVELQRAGLKIAVLGLTTDDFEYQWRAGPLVIDPPNEVAAKFVPKLKERNDFVIALTHIGVDADKSLAANSDVDLVVGGHWHWFLKEPIYQNNLSGEPVPIVQAGQHAEAVGDLLVDLEPGQPVHVVRYQLIPISSSGPRDPGMDAAVHESRAHLDQQYDAGWLHEVIAWSDVPILRPRNSGTVWGDIVDTAMMESAHAELAVDVGDLFGDDQPAGPVTRESLFLLYPRVFKFDEHYGWSVWTADVYGWVLKDLIEAAMHRGVRFNVAGATYDVTGTPGQEKLANFKIGGKPYEALHSYRTAIPEGIGRGATEIGDLFKLIIRSPTDTGVPIWSAVEKKVKSLGVIHPR